MGGEGEHMDWYCCDSTVQGGGLGEQLGKGDADRWRKGPRSPLPRDAGNSVSKLPEITSKG